MILTGYIGAQIGIKTLESAINSNENIFLMSDGGDLYTGLAIYDLYKNKIDTINIIGMCASAATLVLLTAKNRVGGENSRYLIHNPFNSGSGDYVESQRNADLLKIETENLINIYLQYLNIDREALVNLMNENTPITAQKALEINLITKISNMDTNVLKGIENSLNKIMNFFTKPKNLILQDVNGTEIDFGSEITDPAMIQIGTKATFSGDTNTGEFTVGNGTTYVFENGVVTEIKMPEMEEEKETEITIENKILKSKITDLENELSKVKNENSQIFAEKESIKNEVQKLSNEFLNFKNQFSKETAPVNVPAVEQNKTNQNKSFNWTKKKTI